MAGQTKTIACTNRTSYRNRSLFMIGCSLVVLITLVFTFCSTAPGQNPKYDDAEIDARYRMESIAPIYINDRRPRFEELSEEEKKAINSRNRTSRSNISADSKKVDLILEGSGSLDDPIVKEFFNGYVFAQMTQTDEETVSKLGELRAEFLKDYLSKSVSGSRRQQFIDGVVIPSLNNIINNKDLKNPGAGVEFHPAVRLNAVFIMGMLDSQAANRIANQVPIPSTAAWDQLNNLFRSANMPAFLKVAALAGIQRHLEIDRVIGNQIADDSKQQLLSVAADVITGNAAGQDQWGPELNYWLKRRAIQILGLAGEASSLDTVLATLKAEDARDWLQFDALEAVGKLDLKSLPAEKITESTIAISDYLAATIKGESETIRGNVQQLIYDNMLFQNLDLEQTGTDYESGETLNMGSGAGGKSGFGRPSLGSMGGGGVGDGAGVAGGPGGLGGFGRPGDEEEEPMVELPNYQLNQSRRRIKAFAFTGKMLLKNEGKGLHELADDDTKKFIDQIVNDLDNLLDNTNKGIINLDERRSTFLLDDEDEQKSITESLAELCAKTAADMSKKIRNQKGEDEVNPLAGPGDAADTGAAPGNNN